MIKVRINCLICSRTLLQDKDVLQSPLCGICTANAMDFIDRKYPQFSCGFVLLELRKYALEGVSSKIKEGLKKARLSGKQIGRPRSLTISDEEATALHESGISLGEIASKAGTSKSAVWQAVQRHKKRITNGETGRGEWRE